MDFSAWFGPQSTLITLFVSGFLAATLLPGGSEAFLLATVTLHPHLLVEALFVATAGNTLGGVASYLIGRLLPEKQTIKHLDRVRAYGTPILLLAWVPWIGDALCVAAGWLRLNLLLGTFYMAIGKFARYWVLSWAIT